MTRLFDKIQNKAVSPRVTFVCTGNICRSAYAEAALRHGLSKGGNRFSVTVDSAGTQGLLNQPMYSTTREHIRTTYGEEFSHHSSQRLDKRVIRQNSLLLCMTKEHQNKILFQFPSAVKRTFLLSEFSYLLSTISPGEATTWDYLIKVANDKRSLIPPEPQSDIEDPYGRELSIHEQVYQNIDSLLKPIINILK